MKGHMIRIEWFAISRTEAKKKEVLHTSVPISQITKDPQKNIYVIQFSKKVDWKTTFISIWKYI